MFYFGSRHFGQANFGYGVGVRTVDEVQTTSNMGVAGYLLFSDCTVESNGVSNTDVAGGIERIAYLHIKPSATVTMSGLQMRWSARVDLGTGTAAMSSSSYIAWDSQFISDSVWTTQEVD